jgi:predicted MFS family arabinose efflux permease
MQTTLIAGDMRSAAETPGAVKRFAVLATTAFLTLVDLFATQAILPVLARAYGVTPAAMGLAVNATTLGMAVAGLAVALAGSRIPRRTGIVASLGLLAIPTALLASAHGLIAFAVLRLAQGLLMSTAFTLTLAHLGEACGKQEAAGAFAAYIAGNVASNLIGRMVAAGLADHFGLAVNFYGFALLNLSGALLTAATIGARSQAALQSGRESAQAVLRHLRDTRLLPAFAIGFCILFAFIGTFTYVNFVLVRQPLALGMMAVGLSYLAFAPSMVTTTLAGRAVRSVGTRRALHLALGIAAPGLLLLLAPALGPVVLGMVLVACGTFAAQAVATGYVGRVATEARSAASGLYLTSYFTGGLAGSFVLGQVFDRLGWAACVAGVGLSLLGAALLTSRLKEEC